jgi:hypothetical protein
MSTATRRFRNNLATFAAAGLLAGCDDAGTSATPDASDVSDASGAADVEAPGSSDLAIELEGVWVSEFGEETITATTWTGYVAQAIISFDNLENVAILQNPADDAYAPNKFARVVWTELEADAFHYCITSFGHDTAEAAEAAPEANVDRSDLDVKGCGGFAWSFLTRKAQ